jgi:hypothetical protein
MITEPPWTEPEEDNLELKQCCNFLEDVSKPEPHETFGYQTIQLSLDCHKFEHRFLATRMALPILGKDFLSSNEITFDSVSGKLSWTSATQSTLVKFKLSCYIQE